MKTLYIFILFSIVLRSSYCQGTSSKPRIQEKMSLTDESKGKKGKENINHWNFGINFGVYFANKYPANFYNGSPSNENTVNYVLSNSYWYNEIKDTLNASSKVVVSKNGYPTDMHYNFVLTGGLFMRYNVDKNWGICLEVNYTKLKSEDVVQFDIDSLGYLTFRQYVNEPIQGVEQRIHMNLLLQRNFWLKSKIYLFLQGGLNLNYTRVMKNSIYIVGKEYNIINIYNSAYIPGGQMQENQVIQGGVGYGFTLGGGVGFPLTDFWGFEPGGFVNYNNVALPGYPDFKVSYGFYVRFLFGTNLPRPEPD